MRPEQVAAKLARLADTIVSLRTLPSDDAARFRADDRNLDAALHRLQVAIQILIDVGSHVVARLGLGPSETSQELLERLERAGEPRPGEAKRFGKLFAFRNRIVHLYDRVDDTIVLGILRDDLGDLEELARRYLLALGA